MNFKAMLGGAFALSGLLGLSGVSIATAQEKVEVLHWWTSGGEAKALNTLKEILQSEGVTWEDMPVAGGGGANAMTVLKARVTAGNPPTAVQLLGFDMHDWAQQGVMNDLSALAKDQHWDDVVYPAYQTYNKYDGKWVSVPVNVHSANWVWMNKANMDKLGIKAPPTNWDELIADLDKAKAAGITPIAHGGQPWQDATTFEDVLLSTGGVDFYKKALIDLDPSALGSDTMKKVFDRVTQLRGYFDPNFSGRDWNLATAMVIKGDALMQFMGDWAKGEFMAASKTPGTDYVCSRFPGTQGDVTFTGDAFAMFKVGAGEQDAQNKFAAAILDPKFQIAFNKLKGSVPVRMDIPDTDFDACAKKGMADMKEASAKGTAFGSLAHGFAAPVTVKNAIFDVVTKELNGEISSADAVKQLVDAVAAAK